MDSRIIEVTQNMMRKLYKLGEDYEPITCNIKKNAVEMVMSNGLIELKAKFPRSIIEDNMDLEEFKSNVVHAKSQLENLVKQERLLRRN